MEEKRGKTKKEKLHNCECNGNCNSKNCQCKNKEGKNGRKKDNCL